MLIYEGKNSVKRERNFFTEDKEYEKPIFFPLLPSLPFFFLFTLLSSMLTLI